MEKTDSVWAPCKIKKNTDFETSDIRVDVLYLDNVSKLKMEISLKGPVHPHRSLFPSALLTNYTFIIFINKYLI